MSVAEVAAAARAAVAELPLGLIDLAEDTVDAAATSWYRVTDGSPDSARDEVHALLENVKDDLRAVRRTLRALPERVETWIAGLGGHRLSETDRGKSPSHKEAGHLHPVERAAALDQARARLPAPVEPRGRATGAWVAPNGTVVTLTSGENSAWFDAATKHAHELELCPPYAPPLLARHIEIQFAMRMRALAATQPPGAPPPREMIAINREPCGIRKPGWLTCHAQLHRFLPPGAELVVVETNGTTHAYRGAQP
ncbi:hypothetical protein GCM10022247_68460 [Allokutzneria multivorans]|uniref:Nucleic acid/nucleotide deaminase of polymorphic system toxin n=1 Tax=Allokutzneria multivorans TaxID=1142134 RepID=A0ABP7TZU5_9PSEU